jgi:hypothetical protein
MFEIRTRLDPEMRDLKKHLQPSVIAGQAKKTAGDRAKTILNRGRGRLREQQRGLRDSAGFQYSLLRKAGQDRDTEPLTDAVRNDPRPLVLLAIVLMVIMSLAWRVLR